MRPGAIAGSANKKRRRLAEKEVAIASKAEEAEEAPTGGAQRSAVDERNKRRLPGRPSADHFGANFGDQYAGKKGARGDVMRKESVAPYAYLPLNPRLLGKKQQRKAIETMGKLTTPIGGKKAKIKGVIGKVGKHGLQARRGRSSSRRER